MMSKSIYKLTVILIAIFSVSTWTVSAEEEWITDEVLKQLSEVRQELKALREEVKLMNTTIGKINTAAVAKPTKESSLDISGSPALGEETAGVAIVEFSDFQCPYCTRHFEQTFPKLEENYIKTGKVLYVAKQFPLDFHAQAKGAAVSALCLETLQTDGFWVAHKKFFKKEVKLNDSEYPKMIKNIGLDVDSFNTCINSDAMRNRVNIDMSEGRSIGVTGTPAFFIGKIENGKVVDGELLSGARAFESFSQVLDKLIE